MLLLFLLVVHQAGTETALLSNLHAILVAQFVGLLHELLHLLHDLLILLLILLLVGVLRLLLWLLIAGRIVRGLLLWLLRSLIPRIRNLVIAHGATATLLLGLPSGLLQFFLKFVK